MLSHMCPVGIICLEASNIGPRAESRSVFIGNTRRLLHAPGVSDPIKREGEATHACQFE